MVYSLNYRRPAYVSDSGRSSMSSNDDTSSRNNSLRSANSSVSTTGIPDALSFDRIISGGTCPPCTVRDFMNYLLVVELAAENLQFFLWYRDYEKRFNEARTADITLAPEWTQQQQESALQIARANAIASKKVATVQILKGATFGNGPQVTISDTKDPFITPPRTPHEKSNHTWEDHCPRMSDSTTNYTASNTESYKQVAGEAFKTAGLRQPFTIQPFREEINRVLATYIVKDAPRELNISGREKSALLQALQYTTHPSALLPVQKTVEYSLRRQAHPNFIRWSICNGNRPRIIFARGLGVSLILAAFVTAIFITLSDVNRGWRALAAFGWLIGISTLIAAWKGMCVVLHGLHHRHLRPWELFEDSESEVEMKKDSFDSLSSANSYEDEPWVIKYQKRNVIRKIFDRQVWVEEPALRQIQDTIFMQAVLCAILMTAVLTALFVAVPGGRLY